MNDFTQWRFDRVSFLWLIIVKQNTAQWCINVPLDAVCLSVKNLLAID